MGKEKSASQSKLSIENQQLRNQVRQLETVRDILKKALRTPRGVFSAGLPQPSELTALYELTDSLSCNFAISVLCSVLGASRTAYYRHKRGGSYQPTARREEKRRLVERVFWIHKRRYGSRRIVAELQDEGHRVGRIRNRLCGSSRPSRTTDSAHGKGYCRAARAAQLIAKPASAYGT